MSHTAQSLPAQSPAIDAGAFDAAIARELEVQTARLRRFETLAIRNEEEMKRRQEEHEAALAAARATCGTDGLDELRRLAQEGMNRARSDLADFTRDLDEIERLYQEAVSGQSEGQG